MERQEIEVDWNELMEELRGWLDVSLREGQYEAIRELLQSNAKNIGGSIDCRIVSYMFAVYDQEREAGVRTVFEKVDGLDELVDRYTRLMFYLRRFDFDVADDSLEELNHFLEERQVSIQELLAILYCGVVHREKVLQIVKDKIVRGEIQL